MSELTLNNFQIEMEEVYLPAYRAGKISDQRTYLVEDIKKLVSDDARWMGLGRYLLGDDTDARDVISGELMLLMLTEKDDVFLSRLHTLFVAHTLAGGGTYDNVIGNATRAVVLDKNNEVAKLIVIDLLQGKSTKHVKMWVEAAVDDAWMEDSLNSPRLEQL